MRLPNVTDPARFRGLFAFDFGDWSAVGYTAAEIAILLESGRFRDGRVFRIRRAWPDGRMELQGVSSARFGLESGMFFSRAHEPPARADFAALRDGARASPPPCRATLQLVARASDYVTALLYPAEYEEDVAAWLLALDFRGGDLVEGGISHVTDFRAGSGDVLDRAQLCSTGEIASRPADEVLRSVRVAVQR